MHTEEKRLLQVTENKTYATLDTKCIHNESNMDTQVRLGEVRQGKVREDNNQPSGKAVLDNEFSEFWNIYDKKRDRAKCRRKWGRLTKTERAEIFEHLPKYVDATPEKQFRKNPLTYLNNRTWEDEELPQSGAAPKTANHQVFDEHKDLF